MLMVASIWGELDAVFDLTVISSPSSVHRRSIIRVASL